MLPALTFGQQYDHVVVTADSFVNCFAPLCSYVEGSLGLSDTVITTEDIHAQFTGRDDPERIRNFIRHAYSNWGTTHVLLGGDVGVVPCRYCFVQRSSKSDNIPCDLYYSDLDRDWDANDNSVFGEPDDSVDLRPDVFLGRVPASSTSSVDLLVDKVLTYTADPNAPYLRNVFLNGFDLYLDPVIYGEIACEFYDTTLIPSSMRPCTKVYDSYTGDHKAATLAALNQGPHIWVHADHSDWNCMGVGWTNHRVVLSNSELAGLTNGPDYTVMMSIGCDVGAFDSSDCAAENFINAPDGGGVAVLANSRAGLLMGPDWHHTASFLQAEYTLAELFAEPEHAALSVLAAVQSRIAPLAETSAVYRWCQYAYSLLGEPAMPVWIPAGAGVGANSKTLAASPEHGPTIVRGVLFLNSDRGPKTGDRPALLDISGRRLMELHPGANDVRHLSPGVYFVRGDDSEIQGFEGSSRQPSAVHKMVIAR